MKSISAGRMHSQQSDAPGEVTAPAGDRSDARNVFTAQDALANAFMVPPQFLQAIRPEAGAIPEAPIIVFINSRSGGRSGAELALALSRSLGRAQVFDLSHFKPDKVLSQLWETFRNARAAGVPNAELYQSRLRILVAGGDGTIAWVLGVIRSLRLHPTPPVAIMPLGTGNDLSRSFGWGPAFEKAWIKGYSGVYNTLCRVKDAHVEDLDCWSVTMALPDSELLGGLPHSLQKLHPVSSPSPSIADGTSPSQPPQQQQQQGAIVRGLFWNYFSVGLDARAAFKFHHLRESKPYLAANRMMNQSWYAAFSLTSGWFCCAKGVAAKVKLEVQRPGSDEWITIRLPTSIKALVVLNLQSYAGGRNLWGSHSARDSADEGGKHRFKEPSTNDGLLEVVGLLNGYHTGLVMGSKGLVHARRLCQASGVRMAVRAGYVRPDGQPSHSYMQVDGEPWMQDVPSSKDNQPIMVEITHAGVSKMLHNHGNLTNVRDVPTLLRAASLPAHAAPARSILQPSSMRASNVPSTTMASLAGTVADSEAVQVGSEPGERGSSFQSTSLQATGNMAREVALAAAGAAPQHSTAGSSA